MLKRLNKVLPELILGILLCGILLQLTGIWLVKDKILYTSGLWIGILTAMGMAVHMAIVIEDAVSMASSSAKLIAMSLLRYIVVVVIFVVMMYFQLGNPIAAFAGVMSLKVAAYLQPFLHKFICKKRGREEDS
ncbi:MAG: hypothetical protein J6A75_05590 [Lachnospiraceae bacterium]|nr:hypothetical protein [Lachnospiraceae bacterium]